MELNGNGQSINRGFFSFKRAILVVVILGLGFGAMSLLAGMKEPPREAEPKEQALDVEGVKPEFKDYPTMIGGFGEAMPVTVVEITPEVAGKVIRVHPRLEAGEMIPEGELLFSIDSRDFQLVYETGAKRLAILKRSLELTKKEYERVKSLFEKNKVGSLSGVDAAEKAYLSVSDMVSQVEQAVQSAQINLDRCRISMPFDGRIQSLSLEKGQYVSPGRPVLSLVDDSVLEIHVPLDSRDVIHALVFEDASKAMPAGWFPDVKPVSCTVKWVDNPDGAPRTGTLHRIVRYNDETHTVTVAIRMQHAAGRQNGHAAPLVAGMFCSVVIPGKTMHRVLKIPRWSVTLEDNVYCAVGNRLKTVPVTVVRAQEDHAFITGKFPDGATVITTRLVDPLENRLVHVTSAPAGDSE